MFNRFIRAGIAGAVALSAALSASAVAASAHSLRIDNQGDHTVNNVYVSPSSSRSWGSDKLNGVMIAGYHLDLNLSDDYCYFDVKVVYTNGHLWETDDFNTCTRDITLNY